MGAAGIRTAGTTVLGARWQVQLIVAAGLGVGGVAMLLDPGRAELVVGLILGAFLLVEGIVYVLGRMGGAPPDRADEIEALRAGVGLLAAALLFGLSFLDAITLTGVRLILIIRGVPFGLLGIGAWVMSRQVVQRFGFLVANVLVVSVGVILFATQFVDDTLFGRIVTVVAWAAIVLGIALALFGLIRARATKPMGTGSAAE